MDCREVQKKLSAFAEGVIPAGERRQITTHLKKCKGCRRDLADLKKTIRYIQQLEEVEPPAWFVQRIMAKVKDSAEKKQGIWQRFFVPLYIKIPLEAVALVCIVVGALYIFKSMEPEMRRAVNPMETKARAPHTARAPQTEKPRTTGKEQPAAVQEGERPRFEKKQRREEDRSVTIAQAPAAPARDYADRELLGDSLKREGGSSLQEGESKGTKALKAKEVSLVVRVRDLTVARTRVEEIVRKMGGATSVTASRKDQAVIAIALDKDRMSDFLVQLHLIGEVQDRGWQGEQGNGTMTLTVEIKKISGDQPD
jgi:hypothetical protein